MGGLCQGIPTGTASRCLVAGTRKMPAGSSEGAPSHRAELVSECLATLAELVPQLDAAELSHISARHPFASSTWLDDVIAVSEGELPSDVQLIQGLEERLAAMQAQEGALQAALAAAELRASQAEDELRASARAPAPAQSGHLQRGQLPEVQPPPSRGGPVARPRTPAKRPNSGGSTPRSASPRPSPSAAGSAAGSKDRGKSSGKAVPSGKKPPRAGKPSPEAAAPVGEEAEDFWSADPENTHDAEELDEEDEARRERRQSQRFDSISQEIKAYEAGLIDKLSTVEDVDTRKECMHCGRLFKADRLAKHMTVCAKMMQGQETRGVFNATAPQTPGVFKSPAKSSSKKAKPKTPSKSSFAQTFG